MKYIVYTFFMLASCLNLTAQTFYTWEGCRRCNRHELLLLV